MNDTMNFQMKYQLRIRSTHFIELLRPLITTGGVLLHTWEFRSLFSSVDYFGSNKSRDLDVRLFPEIPEGTDENNPFKLTGVRLVERCALAWDFQETELVRYASGSSGPIDIRVLIDGGITIIETDDDRVYLALQSFDES